MALCRSPWQLDDSARPGARPGSTTVPQLQCDAVAARRFRTPQHRTMRRRHELGKPRQSATCDEHASSASRRKSIWPDQLACSSRTSRSNCCSPEVSLTNGAQIWQVCPIVRRELMHDDWQCKSLHSPSSAFVVCEWYEIDYAQLCAPILSLLRNRRSSACSKQTFVAAESDVNKSQRLRRRNLRHSNTLWAEPCWRWLNTAELSLRPACYACLRARLCNGALIGLPASAVATSDESREAAKAHRSKGRLCMRYVT